MEGKRALSKTAVHSGRFFCNLVFIKHFKEKSFSTPFALADKHKSEKSLPEKKHKTLSFCVAGKKVSHCSWKTWRELNKPPHICFASYLLGWYFFFHCSLGLERTNKRIQRVGWLTAEFIIQNSFVWFRSGSFFCWQKSHKTHFSFVVFVFLGNW